MSILDWLYPRKCLGCNRLGRYICLKCLKSVSLRDDWRCPECSRQAMGGVVHLGCEKKYGLDGLVSLLSYKGLVRLGIWSLKYQFLKDIKSELMMIIDWSLKERLKRRQGIELNNFIRKKPVVMAVPLYWRRQNWRGFNQAEMIGEMMAESLGLKLVKDELKRLKPTQAQTKLKKKERQENIKRAFVMEGGGEERVLLVDDVWTTGATMRSAGRALKQAGAGQVWGLSLAR